MKRHAGLLLLTLSLATLTGVVYAAEISEKTNKLVTTIHEANECEVDLGELAFEKGKNVAVKEFGQHMRMAHKESDAKLMKVIATQNLTIRPKTAKPNDDREKLAQKSGLDFDIAYIHLMIEKHSKLKGKLKSAQGWLPEGELRTFVDETATTVNHHLMNAEQIEIDLKAMK